MNGNIWKKMIEMNVGWIWTVVKIGMNLCQKYEKLKNNAKDFTWYIQKSLFSYEMSYVPSEIMKLALFCNMIGDILKLHFI